MVYCCTCASLITHTTRELCVCSVCPLPLIHANHVHTKCSTMSSLTTLETWSFKTYGTCSGGRPSSFGRLRPATCWLALGVHLLLLTQMLPRRPSVIRPLVYLLVWQQRALVGRAGKQEQKHVASSLERTQTPLQAQASDLSSAGR